MVAETEGGEERDKGSEMCQGACRLAVQPGLTANYRGDGWDCKTGCAIMQSGATEERAVRVGPCGTPAHPADFPSRCSQSRNTGLGSTSFSLLRVHAHFIGQPHSSADPASPRYSCLLGLLSLLGVASPRQCTPAILLKNSFIAT